MSEHPKEPWCYTADEWEDVIDGDDETATSDGYPVNGAGLIDAAGKSVFTLDLGDYAGLSTATARRIVECVNACAGIDDPQAWVDNARFYSHETVSAITKQRDELLAALKGLHCVCRIALRGKGGHQYDYFETPTKSVVQAGLAMHGAESAIARAEGREDSECST